MAVQYVRNGELCGAYKSPLIDLGLEVRVKSGSMNGWKRESRCSRDEFMAMSRNDTDVKTRTRHKKKVKRGTVAVLESDGRT